MKFAFIFVILAFGSAAFAEFAAASEIYTALEYKSDRCDSTIIIGSHHVQPGGSHCFISGYNKDEAKISLVSTNDLRGPLPEPPQTPNWCAAWIKTDFGFVESKRRMIFLRRDLCQTGLGAASNISMESKLHCLTEERADGFRAFQTRSIGAFLSKKYHSEGQLSFSRVGDADVYELAKRKIDSKGNILTQSSCLYKRVN